MNSKSKIVAAIAAGAVAITVGAGAARCSANPPEPSDSQQAAQEQAEENDGGTQAGKRPEQEMPQEAGRGGFAALANTSWTSEDGASQLSITKDALIERTAEGANVIYYAVTDESTDATGLSAMVSASDDIAGPGAATVIRIEENAGSLTLTCDLLKAIYIENAKTETSLSLSGDIDDLCLLSGKGPDDFRETLESFAKAHSPYATTATWDKEAWIDYSSHSVLTTFTLDDAASTIVTVSVSQDGAMEAM